MTRIPQSLLLAKEHVPHLVNYGTRDRVLAAYRRLHRNLNCIEDPLAKPHLKLLAQHRFARFKYINNAHKVTALLDYAETHELLWATRAAMGKHKELFKCLEVAFTTYKVRKPALSAIVFSENPYLRSTYDGHSIAYRLNNIATPSPRDFMAYETAEAKLKSAKFASLDAYAQLVKVLRSNRVHVGKQKRKLVLSLQDMNGPRLTVLGSALPLNRQANILKKLYAQLLRDAPRPVHPEVLDHIEQRLQKRGLTRVYRRRLKELSHVLYTVDGSGQMRHVDPLL